MKSNFHILTVGVAAVVCTACSETCNDNKNAIPLAGFYQVDSIAEQVSVESIEIIAVDLGADSVLSEAAIAKEQVYLPFRIDSDITQYAFVDKSEGAELADTVTFVYSRTPVFANAACGVSYVYDMREITWQGTLIDSVTCPKGFINNVNEENLRVYFSDIVNVQ